VVKLGRIAGQYAKPRSSNMDSSGQLSYRGDMVNELEGDRTPDPRRILRAYHTAASTLNLLRAYAGGGLASLDRVHSWNTEFARSTDTASRHEQLAAEIARAVQFMRACGVRDAALDSVELYAGHEALILDYERALTRVEDGRAYDLSGHFVCVGARPGPIDRAPTPAHERALGRVEDGRVYGLSGHFVWVGERTRQLDGAHIDFVSRIAN